MVALASGFLAFIPRRYVRYEISRLKADIANAAQEMTNGPTVVKVAASGTNFIEGGFAPVS
jgi:hypothetical protein